mmetsp:Transcript_34017/g.71595  ORF Transcript_34017/g.71595 Transcript_34017/m.71595 type:complete len:213 (-) Transcript_34017:907-1545(-)
MVRFVLIVELHATLVDDERVSHEEVGDVARERVVDARLLELLVPKVVHRRRHVVELLVTRAAVGQVARDGVVARLWERRGACAGESLELLRRERRVLARVCLAALERSAVVHGGGDGRPPHVRVGQLASEDGRGGGEREQDGREHREVVVQVARLVNVTRLERHLQTAAAHAVRHGVHPDAALEVLCRCVHVLPQRHADVDVAPAASADVLR